MPGVISSASKVSSSFSELIAFDVISSISHRQLVTMSDREMDIIATAIQLEVMKNPNIQAILAEKVKELLVDL